ncbi:hypothetical protein EV292_103189 [Sphingomonas sp. BK235]|nr:hypothetical protein EV292_103189 [Sphingomonas sp. BK235]
MTGEEAGMTGEEAGITGRAWATPQAPPKRRGDPMCRHPALAYFPAPGSAAWSGAWMRAKVAGGSLLSARS